MSATICLSSDAIGDPGVAGHLWVYLNWALSARALGCRVIWLEEVSASAPAERTQARVAALKAHLAPYGLADCLALFSRDGRLSTMPVGCLRLEDATEADLLLTLRYDTPADVVTRFRRAALVDIDPGLLQLWIVAGDVSVARHDVCFTTGEGVGWPGSRIPDAGLSWFHVPPCVALDWWPVSWATDGAAFTTVTQWSEDSWVGGAVDGYRNDKRSGFLPLRDLPSRTAQRLELAVVMAPKEYEERVDLERRGWRVRDASEVASTPEAYQRHIQASRGEFSCAKPSCMLLQNAWVSDRTICYLASGKPVVVQHTGPSRFLPEAAGMFRFRDATEAVRYLELAAADYDRQCALARRLAEEYFDGRKVLTRVLERALT